MGLNSGLLRSWKRIRFDWTQCLFIFIAFVLFHKARLFVRPDFIFAYPYISFDGYQWITDGLHYLNRSLEASHRNPLLPITFMLLGKLGLVDLYPLLIACVTIAVYGSCYWFLRAFFYPSVTRLTILWFFFVFRIHNFFDFVLADPWCLTCVVFGFGCLVRLKRDPRYLLGAAGAFGLALNYQFAPVFMSPALLWYLTRYLRGINFVEIRGLLVKATILFLVLALPQFIYKWIAFGSPLYSHIIHFPLIRLHLFGLPYYTLNFVAFLGWPLAACVTVGWFKCVHERRAEWELVNLSWFCMFFFWILMYLWLDVRFMLYLVPFWMIYAGRTVQVFNVQNWLSWRGKGAFQCVLIVFAIYFGVGMALYPVGAFEGSLLPLTPQTALRFSSTPISIWGVGALTFDKITTEYQDTDTTLFPINAYRKFYKGASKADSAATTEYLEELRAIAAKLSESEWTERVALCGAIGETHESRLRTYYTVQRNIRPCDVGGTFVIANRAVAAPANTDGSRDLLFDGKELRLYGPRASLTRSPQ